jgi:hypothetical protein
MMKRVIVQLGFLLITHTALAQMAQNKLPCAYSGDILQDKDGKTARFTSDEMKARATHKVDISSGSRRADRQGYMHKECCRDSRGRRGSREGCAPMGIQAGETKWQVSRQPRVVAILSVQYKLRKTRHVDESAPLGV